MSASGKMEFYAVTTQGIIIMDASTIGQSSIQADGWRDWTKGLASDGLEAKVVATIPSPASAFCHTWSADGSLLASVCDEGARVFDATNAYKQVCELPRVQENVEGRQGGVRNLQFSPMMNFMVIYEKWEPGLDNVHVWDIRNKEEPKRLHDCLLKAYASGDLPVEMVKWTFDESVAVEFVPGEGIRIWEPDFSNGADTKMIPEKAAAHFQLSPKATDGACYVAIYVPEHSGRVARCLVYHLKNLAKPTTEILFPPQVKGCKIYWNCEGTALLALASSDVDPTGHSYFGTTYLYWAKADGKAKKEIYSAQDGLVQDLAWSPTKNEFMVIVGMLPATVRLHDGATGAESSTLGSSRRNTLCWNPFGRFIAVGGFGTLPGDVDFFDRSTEETLCSLRAALTVNCSWSPDGRMFLSATVAPRMNEGNQISIYQHTGEQLIQFLYKPEHIEGRHEDTGAGARTKTQAILYASGWRPGQEVNFEDRPATPRPGQKRKKGLPVEEKKPVAAAAWKPRGESGGSLVAAMMRGEISTPEPSKGSWDTGPEVKQLEDWEVRKLERERKKAEEQRLKDEEEARKQAIRDVEKELKGSKKELKELKQQLEDLQKLKDKDWDELTEEDEESLDKEQEILTRIAQLEKSLS
mmetsp:Transcript_63010/g.150103  ORF Transcript_63010/g.150103 Transcript_63010/m.150103 type:complete len:638 (+) Transcript_63010:78-1991(+)